MSVKTRGNLQGTFITGAKPTQANFSDWLDSFWHVNDSLPGITSADVLPALAAATTAQLRTALRDAVWTVTGKIILVNKASPAATDSRVVPGIYNLSVPFLTIQAALNVCTDDDVIVVEGGPYTENLQLPVVLLSSTATIRTVNVVLNASVITGNFSNGAGATAYYRHYNFHLVNHSSIVGSFSTNVAGREDTITITSDKTGIFDSSGANNSVYQLVLNNLQRVNAGAYKIVGKVYNCDYVVGGMAAFARNVIEWDASGYAAAGSGYNNAVDFANVKRVINPHFPANGYEAYPLFENCAIELTGAYNFNNAYYGYFRRCTFKYTGGVISGFSNNPGALYDFVSCEFQVQAGSTYAVSIGLASGSKAFFLNCIANSTKVADDTQAGYIGNNNFTNSAFIVF